MTHGWHWIGRDRPPWADAPGPDQESVWDYPRPPRLAPDARRVVVAAGDTIIADTTRAVRVLETASPPTFYCPPEDVRHAHLAPAPGASGCEWKGTARYWDVITPAGPLARAAWSYPDPTPAFASLRDWLSFYPALLTCTVDGVPAQPQGGGFYGGWVTPEIVGPWKGDPGTGGW